VLRLPAFDDLWTTGYGHVLIVKLSLVAVALGWGAFHHFVVEPRLGRPHVAGHVRGSLAGETAVGLAVLLVAAFLVNSKPPARSSPPALASQAHQRGPSGGSLRPTPRPAQVAVAAAVQQAATVSAASP
jgi:hypothetical protein